jgi:Spy/CpxP family protein refolding chaperone
MKEVHMRLAIVSAVAVAVAGGAVLAHEGGGSFMRRHGAWLGARIEAAIDAAHPTPEQRARLEQAKERAFQSFHAAHKDGHERMQKVMALFEADTVDAAQVSALRKAHLDEARAAGDAVLDALSDAHDTLDAGQRKAVADYLRAHKPEAPPKAVGEWLKKRIYSHVEDALDQVKASPAQKEAVEASLDQVWDAVRAEHEAGAGHMDKALELFESDRLDRAQIDQLRAENQARHQKIGDAVTQAFREIHDTFTPAQRKQLVAWVRANHPHM